MSSNSEEWRNVSQLKNISVGTELLKQAFSKLSMEESTEVTLTEVNLNG